MIRSFRQPQAARGARLTPYNWRLSDPKMYVSANQMFGAKADVGRQIAASLRGIGNNIRNDRIRDEQQQRADAIRAAQNARADRIRAENNARQDARWERQDARQDRADERADQRFEWDKRTYEDKRSDRNEDKSWRDEQRSQQRKQWGRTERDSDQRYQQRKQQMDRASIEQEIKIAERFRQRAAKVKNPNEWGHLIDRFDRLGFKDVDQYRDFSTGRARVLSEMDSSIADLKRRKMELQNKKLERDLNPGETPQWKNPGEKAKTEIAVRKEFARLTDEYQQLKGFEQRLATAPNNGPGNLSLVFSFMKMLDPTSVVREGEQASARNAGGVPDSIRSLYNSAIAGGMSPNMVQQFKAEAARIMNLMGERNRKQRKFFEESARRQGLDPRNILMPEPQEQPTSTAPSLDVPPGVTITVEEN